MTLLAGLMLPTLIGCGSSVSDPLSVTCTSQKLPSGFVRAYVKVTNTTSNPIKAFVYGPALQWLRHYYPFLRPTQVVVQVDHKQQTYVGFVIPHLASNSTAHLILRFEPSPKGRGSILASDTRTVQASDWTLLKNPSCVIRKLR